jgi:hypothetical protein
MKPTIEKMLKGKTLKRLNYFILMLVMAPLLSACGMHYNIKGKVINGQTGQPVEGAVVDINWIRYKLGPPGLPLDMAFYGTTERLTDAEGGFTIPKYTFGTHFMGVYKKGFVCWSSDTKFNPQGKTEDEMFVHRYVKVKNGMVIKLEPKDGNFPAVKHASFVQSVDTGLGSPIPLFTEATNEEYKIYENFVKNQMRKKKK